MMYGTFEKTPKDYPDPEPLFPPPGYKMITTDTISISMSNTFNVREMMSSSLTFQMSTVSNIIAQLKEGKTATAEIFLDHHLMHLATHVTRDTISEIKIICNLREIKNEKTKLKFMKTFFDDMYECMQIYLRKVELTFQSFEDKK